MTEQELKRKNRELTKALRDLTNLVSQHIAGMDAVMKRPSNEDRGRTIANMCNNLDIANDSVLHFTLGQSFQSISGRKAKMARQVAKGASHVF